VNMTTVDRIVNGSPQIDTGAGALASARELPIADASALVSALDITPVVEAVVARVAAKERLAVARAIKRAEAGTGDAADWWVRFGVGQVEYLADAIVPVLRAVGLADDAATAVVESIRAACAHSYASRDMADPIDEGAIVAEILRQVRAAVPCSTSASGNNGQQEGDA